MNKAFNRKEKYNYIYKYKCSCEKQIGKGGGLLPVWNCYHLAA